jgi:hypothetical protein
MRAEALASSRCNREYASMGKPLILVPDWAGFLGLRLRLIAVTGLCGDFLWAIAFPAGLKGTFDGFAFISRRKWAWIWWGSE